MALFPNDAMVDLTLLLHLRAARIIAELFSKVDSGVISSIQSNVGVLPQ